jgi:mitochondrial ATPase complex subunit ATP10
MQLSGRPLRIAYTSLEASSCLLCQWRSFSVSYRRRAEKDTPSKPPSALDHAPRAYGQVVEEFTPKPLDRPIGLPNPPRPGENTGIDHRTLKERRDDFVNYDKHLIKRKQLYVMSQFQKDGYVEAKCSNRTQKISTPYFREWTNMRHHKGKSFLAPPRLFKSDKALYFPNLYGQTLIKKSEPRDTTPVLEGKVSVVSVYSSAWAERQAESFVAEKNNPELHQVVKGSGGVAQMVQINIEENAMKAMIIKMFMPSLRKRIAGPDWGRYFVVRKGLTTEIRDAIGLLNSKVGYIYLLDRNCRIRWAGSGICEGDEKDGLVRGTRRLIEDAIQRKGTVMASAASKRIVEVKT